MRDAMLKRWEMVKATCEALNHGLWIGAYKSEATRRMAEEALEAMQEKAERVARVLRWRWSIEVR